MSCKKSFVVDDPSLPFAEGWQNLPKASNYKRSTVDVHCSVALNTFSAPLQVRLGQSRVFDLAGQSKSSISNQASWHKSLPFTSPWGSDIMPELGMTPHVVRRPSRSCACSNCVKTNTKSTLARNFESSFIL